MPSRRHNVRYCTVGAGARDQTAFWYPLGSSQESESTMLLFKVLDAGRATVASLLRGRRQVAKLAQKAELQQWETEGGTLAPSGPGATETRSGAAKGLDLQHVSPMTK
jgi:hypothetical protein